MTIEKDRLVDEVLKPKPLLFVSTIHNGVVNIGVYGNYITVGYGSRIFLETKWYKGKDKSELKDTLMNVRESKHLTLNVPLKNMKGRVYDIAKPLPRDISEAKEFDIQTKIIRYADTDMPLIEDMAVSIFCKLIREIKVENTEISLLELDPFDYFISKEFSSYDVYSIKQVVVDKGIFHLGRNKDGENLQGFWHTSIF